MAGDIKPINNIAESFWQAWSDRDAERLAGLWDMSDDGCSYLPAQSPARLVGPAAVRNWFSAAMAEFATIRMRPKVVHPRRLNSDLGALFAEIDWLLCRNEAAMPMGGSIRISAVVRGTDDGWRLCHYAEAPLAPIVELRRFYQKIAADGHGGMA
jgi:uncharacterized protein (TIGR02246 family)